MGIFDKFKSGLKKTREAMSTRFESVISGFKKVDEALFEELEEVLISADVGVDTSLKTVSMLRDETKKNKVTDPYEIKAILKKILLSMINDETELDISKKPAVVLVIGVNGVGKTTTIGKLSAKFSDEGKKVIIAAADTFRAAAAEQLDIWAKRSKAEIIRHSEGADPAAVIFDAISAAKARGSDVIICDTAGRIHNKKNLMNELSKLDRVISRELPDASRETLLVLDATTGQNAIIQAREFNEAAKITGIVLTKLDGTAKGGVVIAISDIFNIPIKYIGVGEGIDDLLLFNAPEFIEAIF